ncbi:MAG TPA: NrfD/PsrC family molybdoenzyme membrane anchor subunit [Bacteroidales bacterium]|nr:NrfD/PsrC family molybdoenzyme membrane anchor subunit [Bacteroidales bacterium]
MSQKMYDREKLIDAATAPVNFANKSFLIWMSLLGLALMICLYGYFIQLREGLGVTGLRDYITWGMYIANFVFFVAASLVGMLISSVLGLIGIKWITPITRIAEIIAIAFAAVAGLVIVSDMGRPDRLINVFVFGRFQSPILWDITVVTTYVAISVLLYFLPLIPDLAICKERIKKAPPLLQKTYHILSMNWIGSAEQAAIMRRAVRILLILIVPVALSIHTVTSWLFAVTTRPGWDSTIFGPYFVTGAFVAGTAAVIIAMYFFRKNYKLHEYLEDLHFDKMGKLLVLVSLVYLYFNVNEFLVPAYKLKRADVGHLHELFVGHHALMFWFAQLTGLIIPIILLLFKPFRKPLPITIISAFVVVASWFKRYLIVVPTMEHPYLPIQHVPHHFMHYSPTLIETGITVASFLLVLIIITILSKSFPVLPIYEMTELHSEEEYDDHDTQTASKKSSLGKILPVSLVLLTISSYVSAQDWTVPEDKSQKVSPFKFNSETVKSGEAIFQKNCVSCHGEPSKGSFNKDMQPSPGDPAGTKFQSETDGALFHKITTGRAPMPEFKNVLTEDERWQVIAYIRSFNPKYVQPEPVAAPAGAYAGMNISARVDYVAAQHKIKVTTTGNKSNVSNPLAGIEVVLWAHRYFGDLMIDEPKTTDASGNALFDYKESIPGDTAGNVKFIVKLNAEGLSGFKKDTTLAIGKLMTAKSLIATRAMWTVRSQAPIWLIAAYSIVVISIWSVLAYIVVLIFRIKKAGDTASDNQNTHTTN